MDGWTLQTTAPAVSFNAKPHMSAPQPAILPPLADYLEASSQRFASCISALDEGAVVEGVQAETTMHFVKFDPTSKEPRFDELAKALARHVVEFCLSARTREKIRQMPNAETELFMRARDYFRKVEDAGDVGELLLFFLLEAALGAPQIVCKMELKTNSNDEVKGADGIHVRWDETDDHLDVLLGEAKLYQGIGAAMDSTLKSIKEFHEERRVDQELHLATAHFKHLDEDFQRRVSGFINRESDGDEYHIIHACLIGWDWTQYKRLADERDQLFDEFEAKYQSYCGNIGDLLGRRFDDYPFRHLSFHFIFLPFSSVREFRRSFYRELLGTDLPSSKVDKE